MQMNFSLNISEEIEKEESDDLLKKLEAMKTTRKDGEIQDVGYPRGAIKKVGKKIVGKIIIYVGRKILNKFRMENPETIDWLINLIDEILLHTRDTIKNHETTELILKLEKPRGGILKRSKNIKIGFNSTDSREEINKKVKDLLRDAQYRGFLISSD